MEEWAAVFPQFPKGLSAIYDGDTPVPSARKKIRQTPPPIVISNPDMLHMGILPYHEQWKEFFKNLKLVVIDEAHVYKGILGSHLVQIIRSLRRICRLYQSASPVRSLFGHHRPSGTFFRVADRPFFSGGSGIRLSFSGQTFSFSESGYQRLRLSVARLFTYCLSKGKKTILFTQGRRQTELIHMWVEQMAPTLKGKNQLLPGRFPARGTADY